MSAPGRQQRESWFSANVNPLLSKMVEAMVIERPDNPRAWIADYVERDEGSESYPTRTERGRAPENRRVTPPDHNPNRSCWAASRPQAPTAADTTSRGSVEADTEDPEEISDLNALLLPSGALPLDVERFSVSYSRALLEGWVKQGSPCCAAASLAGAWNALSGKPRGAEGALNSESVLRAMQSVVEEQICGMVARFERLLGASLEPLLQALDAELAAEGKHLGGRGPKTAVANGPHLLRLTRAITTRERERAGHPATFDLLWELYEKERKEAAEAEAAAATKAAVEAVAGAISAGSAAAVAVAAGGSNAGGRARGATLNDGSSGARQKDVATGSVVSAGQVREGVDVEEGGSTVLGKTSVGVVPAASPTAEGTAAAAEEGSEKKVPRRPSTGRPRGVGVGNISADFRPGSALRRPRSAGDVTPVGVVGVGGDRGAREEPRLCWGGDEEVKGEDRVRRTTAEWTLEIEADEVKEEEEEREEEEGADEELGMGTIPALRRCSSGGSGEKGKSTEGKQRRRSSRKGTRGSRRGTKDSPGTSQGRRASAATTWRWKEDLCALLKRMGGLEKLCATRPSTAAIGNLGLIATVRHLDGTMPGNAEVTARLFMGKGGRQPSARLQVPLSHGDDEEKKAKQWAALREAFLSDRQVLLFHLTNHYALIFGLREWCPSSSSGCRTAAPGADFGPRNNDTGYVGRGNGQAFQRRESEAEETLVVTASEASASCVDAVHTGDGAVGRGKGGGGSRSSKSGGSVARQILSSGSRWKRQILTARRGQRPTAWMDFEDVRKILLGWEGYKIMAVIIGKKGAPR